jgi:hypothetical protein
MSDRPLAALHTDPSVEEVHIHLPRVVGVTSARVSALGASEEQEEGRELQALVERLAAIGDGGGDE